MTGRYYYRIKTSRHVLGAPLSPRGAARQSRFMCGVLVSGVFTWFLTYGLLRTVKDKHPVIPTATFYGYTDPLRDRIASEAVAQGNFSLTCPLSVDNAFRDILQKTASNSGVLMLALADDGYLDMTLNFYETSLKPLAINNVLFISPLNKTCQVLAEYNLACHVYKSATLVPKVSVNSKSKNATSALPNRSISPKNKPNVSVKLLPVAPGGRIENNTHLKKNVTKKQGPTKAPVKSEYGTAVFNKKMVLRTMALRDALSCGLTILHTDVDITLFQNPFSYFKCTGCDIEALEDGWKENLNAGFVYMKPTKGTMTVYNRLLNITSNPKVDDQVAFNMALAKYRKNIRVKALDTKKFPCGKLYYEQAKRYFVDDMKPCPECVMVHNNWIVSKEAKIYRFRETGQWTYDGPDKYYTDPNRKYLTFKNPLQLKDEENALSSLENSSLVSALAIAQLLNRTLILPKFHCGMEATECPINSLYRISSLQKTFPGMTRESVFLQHPKIPESIKNNQSPLIIVDSKVPFGGLCKPPKELETLVCSPSDPTQGLTSEEVLRCVQSVKHYTVLRFHTLYGAFSHFENSAVQKNFTRTLKSGLAKTVYRQYPDSVTKKMAKKQPSTMTELYINLKKHFWGPDFLCH